jgi:excisionase family DNA binding protein
MPCELDPPKRSSCRVIRTDKLSFGEHPFRRRTEKCKRSSGIAALSVPAAAAIFAAGRSLNPGANCGDFRYRVKATFYIANSPGQDNQAALKRCNIGCPMGCRCTTLSLMSEDDFDVQRLATYLHLMPDQVSRLADRGKLPGRKVQGQWRFSQADVHHWLERRIGLSDDEELQQMESILRAASGQRPIPSPTYCPCPRFKCRWRRRLATR